MAVSASADLATRWEAAQREYGKKCRTFARNSFRQIPGYSVEDVEQEMLMELWKCVQRYDPDRGASFNTLFQGCARNRVISLIRHYQTKGRTGYVSSLDDEAVAAAAEQVIRSPDPEEQALLRIELRETLVERGLDVAAGSGTSGRSRRTA